MHFRGLIYTSAHFSSGMIFWGSDLCIGYSVLETEPGLCLPNTHEMVKSEAYRTLIPGPVWMSLSPVGKVSQEKEFQAWSLWMVR